MIFLNIKVSADSTCDLSPELIESYGIGITPLYIVRDEQTLRDAQAHPENYRGLLVRVAGYSDYFVDLDNYQQEEIIARNAQECF